MIARYGSKHHEMCQSLVLLVFLTSLACKPSAQKPQPAEADAAPKEELSPAAAPGQPASVPPIETVELGPLVLGSGSALIAKLQQAHYDPTALGLQELRYQVDYTWAKRDVQAKAEGRWDRGGQPEVTLLEVARGGQIQRQPRPDQVSQDIWESIKHGIEGLLQGLGHGFLSERLEQWAAMEGPARSVRLEGDRLQLELGGEEGSYSITIGPGYQVLTAAHRSSEGIIRRMDYSYRTELGRHLITRAVFSAELPRGEVASDEVRDLVASSHGMVFSLAYTKHGRFWLPTRLEKEMPVTKDRVTLSLKYLQVRP